MSAKHPKNSATMGRTAELFSLRHAPDGAPCRRHSRICPFKKLTLFLGRPTLRPSTQPKRTCTLIPTQDTNSPVSYESPHSTPLTLG
mgnify:CR=1 FL=1